MPPSKKRGGVGVSKSNARCLNLYDETMHARVVKRLRAREFMTFSMFGKKLEKTTHYKNTLEERRSMVLCNLPTHYNKKQRNRSAYNAYLRCCFPSKLEKHKVSNKHFKINEALKHEIPAAPSVASPVVMQEMVDDADSLFDSVSAADSPMHSVGDVVDIDALPQPNRLVCTDGVIVVTEDECARFIELREAIGKTFDVAFTVSETQAALGRGPCPLRVRLVSAALGDLHG